MVDDARRGGWYHTAESSKSTCSFVLNLITEIFQCVSLPAIRALKFPLPGTHDFATLLANDKAAPSGLSIKSALERVSLRLKSNHTLERLNLDPTTHLRKRTSEKSFMNLLI